MNKLCDLFQLTKALDLPNPTVNHPAIQNQRQLRLNQFQEHLNYLQTVVKGISLIKERLDSESKILGLDPAKLSQGELLGLVMGNPISESAKAMLKSEAYANLVDRKRELQEELEDKRNNLIKIADDLRTVEWQIGALVEKE